MGNASLAVLSEDRLVSLSLAELEQVIEVSHRISLAAMQVIHDQRLYEPVYGTGAAGWRNYCKQRWSDRRGRQLTAAIQMKDRLGRRRNPGSCASYTERQCRPLVNPQLTDDERVEIIEKAGPNPNVRTLERLTAEALNSLSPAEAQAIVEEDEQHYARKAQELRQSAERVHGDKGQEQFEVVVKHLRKAYSAAKRGKNHLKKWQECTKELLQSAERVTEGLRQALSRQRDL